MRLYTAVRRQLALLLKRTVEDSPDVADSLAELRVVDDILGSAELFHAPGLSGDGLVSHPAFAGSERYLGPQFQLPSPSTYVEDEQSGVCLYDLEAGQRGIGGLRMFVLIEPVDVDTAYQGLAAGERFRRYLELPPDLEGSMLVHCGSFSELNSQLPVLRPNEEPLSSKIALAVRSSVAMYPNATAAVVLNPFAPQPERPGLCQNGSPLTEVVQHLGVFSQNIRHAMRQSALYRLTAHLQNAPVRHVALFRE